MNKISEMMFFQLMSQFCSSQTLDDNMKEPQLGKRLQICELSHNDKEELIHA
jgi:hypothetical protein